MRYKLRVYSIMEFGQRVDAQGNPHQEDCLFPEFGTQSSADRLFVLCDGMGGHSAGEVASATVCEAMGHSALASMEGGDGLFTDDMLQRAIDDAFDALDAKDNGAEKKMGTTMTLLMLHDGGATVAHMGDSRVYQIRPGEDAAHTSILFETEDHSLVNDLIKVDLLTPEEARVSPQKNVITRAMQPHMEHRPKADVAHLTDIRPGDYFYMCTDGMLEQMDDTNIRFIFSDKGGDAQNKVGILTQATVENRDNHTAFVIEILDVEGEPVMTAEQSAPAAGAHCIMAELEDGDDEAEEASDEVSADSDTDDTHGSDDAQQEPVTATIKNGRFRDQTLTVINRRHGNIFSDLLAALGGGKERQQLLQYIIIGVVVLLLGIIIIMGVRKLKFGPSQVQGRARRYVRTTHQAAPSLRLLLLSTMARPLLRGRTLPLSRKARHSLPLLLPHRLRLRRHLFLPMMLLHPPLRPFLPQLRLRLLRGRYPRLRPTVRHMARHRLVGASASPIARPRHKAPMMPLAAMSMWW